MLRTMSSLCVPNFNLVPSSIPKLLLIFHFPQANPLAPGLKLLVSTYLNIAADGREKYHICHSRFHFFPLKFIDELLKVITVKIKKNFVKGY